jgi:hypothetical protein
MSLADPSLSLVPSVDRIYTRLGEITRERRLLRRLLRVAVDAHRERERRKHPEAVEQEGRRHE